MPKANKRVRGRRAADHDRRKDHTILEKRLPSQNFVEAHEERVRSSSGMDLNGYIDDHDDLTERLNDYGSGGMVRDPLYNIHSERSYVENIDHSLEDATQVSNNTFYGLLNEEEQEYFRRAGDMLEFNQFNGVDERIHFLANVYREAEGKELKIANSQSCSRLMERLILLSTSDQLKSLFQKFSGHFLQLVQHRFASHCCEALFKKAAAVVSEELVMPFHEQQEAIENIGREIAFVSMENLFLYTLNELEGNLGYLLTDRFASHALRMLLLVLSGRPLENEAAKEFLQSKRKEKITAAAPDGTHSSTGLEQRIIPDSFHQAIDKIMREVTSNMDISAARAIATHPSGSPVLQLLLELEFERDKSQKSQNANAGSLFRKLIPEDLPIAETESATFIKSLIYDPVGSHLVETIVGGAPGKKFKALFKGLFEEQLGVLAKNETAGYVVMRILERLSKDDLQAAIERILPIIETLVEKSRTSIIKTLIERCLVRDIATEQVAEALRAVYGEDDTKRLPTMLGFTDDDLRGPFPEGSKAPQRTPAQIHASFLAQAMLCSQGLLSELIYSSLVAQPHERLLGFATDPIASRVLQVSLTSSSSQPNYRRKVIYPLFGHVGRLALNRHGSHLIDVLWKATDDLSYYKERIADELARSEPALRESPIGRAVWRNWSMDLYKRRKTEWKAKSKEKAFASKGAAINIELPKQAKPGIENARARFAAQKVQRARGKRGKAVTTGSNSIIA